MKKSHAVALIIAAILIIPAVFGIRVALSGIFGQGGAVINKNDAVNRVAAQERFESLFAEIKAADQRLDVLADAVKEDPSYTNKTNLTGGRTYCLSVVADYNAEARKYSARDFRAYDLPAQIDQYDPTTDCKESDR